jgi:hypothetical protein
MHSCKACEDCRIYDIIPFRFDCLPSHTDPDEFRKENACLYRHNCLAYWIDRRDMLNKVLAAPDNQTRLEPSLRQTFAQIKSLMGRYVDL